MGKRIALASSNGERVDRHFAQAESFYVYERTNAGFSLVERRERAAKVDLNSPAVNYHSERHFEAVSDLLQDCAAIFVAQIGPGAAEYLVARGMRVFQAPYSVEEILSSAAESDNL
jgi:nitrogen fixation protein NifX